MNDWLRPPDPDELPGQPWAPLPGTLRAMVIANYLAQAEAYTKIRSRWYGRVLLWLARVKVWVP